MFTAEQRTQLRAGLLEAAKADPRISAAAITGSASIDSEDRWSDIDLAFAIAPNVELTSLLDDWTTRMYDRHHAVHHTDVRAGSWIYRVFLLTDTLQVDLAFAPAADFRPLGPTFSLVFGEANDPLLMPPPSVNDLIGMSWLYALHVRSCIARCHFWQAEYMISGVRDHVLALACLRHNLPTSHGRGFDQLPGGILIGLEATLVRSLDKAELQGAFEAVIAALIKEIDIADPALANRLRTPISELAAAIS